MQVLSVCLRVAGFRGTAAAPSEQIALKESLLLFVLVIGEHDTKGHTFGLFILVVSRQVRLLVLIVLELRATAPD